MGGEEHRESPRASRFYRARCTYSWRGPERPHAEHGKCDMDASAHLAISRDQNCEAWIEARDDDNG